MFKLMSNTRKTKEKCPNCGNNVLLDESVPYYDTGVSFLCAPLGKNESEINGTFKSTIEQNRNYICPECKHCYGVYQKLEENPPVKMDGGTFYPNNPYNIIEEKITDMFPLVEEDGVWLTPRDVETVKYRKEYFAEHGKYPPPVAYA